MDRSAAPPLQQGGKLLQSRCNPGDVFRPLGEANQVQTCTTTANFLATVLHYFEGVASCLGLGERADSPFLIAFERLDAGVCVFFFADMWSSRFRKAHLFGVPQSPAQQAKKKLHVFTMRGPSFQCSRSCGEVNTVYRCDGCCLRCTSTEKQLLRPSPPVLIARGLLCRVQNMVHLPCVLEKQFLSHEDSPMHAPSSGVVFLVFRASLSPSLLLALWVTGNVLKREREKYLRVFATVC